MAVRVAQALDALGIAHTIGGSIAASLAGEPRSTVDIDFVAAIEEHRVPGLAASLASEFYVDEDALRRTARLRGTANLIHQATPLKIDLFVAGGTPLDALQTPFRRATSGRAR